MERSRNIEGVSKQFLKVATGDSAVLSTTQVLSVLKFFNEKNYGRGQEFQFSEQYMLRILKYALIHHRNHLSLSLNNFLTGIKKFGIDSPYLDTPLNQYEYAEGPHSQRGHHKSEKNDSKSQKEKDREIIIAQKVENPENINESGLEVGRKREFDIKEQTDKNSKKVKKKRLGSRRGSGSQNPKNAPKGTSLSNISQVNQQREGYLNMMNGSALLAQHYSIVSTNFLSPIYQNQGVIYD